MVPIFDYLIPAYKIGYFFELCSQQLVEKDADIRNGVTSEAEVARKSWDQVENYMGALNFDNLFWNRTFRVWMQTIFTSVTFFLGNIRALIAPAQGQSEEFGRTFEKVLVPISQAGDDPLAFAASQRQYRAETKFRMPKLDKGLAAILGSLFAMAFLSQMYSLLKRGKSLKTWKDMEAVPTGELDERGKPIRLRWRNYVWMWHHEIFEHPVRTAKYALSPTVTRTVEALENRTFDNEYVFDPDEPTVKKMIDILANMAGIPLTFSTEKQARERGASTEEQVFAALTIKRAPYDFDVDPDEKLALEFIADNGPHKQLTKESAEARRKVITATKKFQGGKISHDELQQLVKDGLISPGSERSIVRNAKKAWIYRLFLHLDADEKLKVFAAASPEHKAILKDLMHLTRRDLIFYSKPKFDELRDKMMRAQEGLPGETPVVPPPVPQGLAPQPPPTPRA